MGIRQERPYQLRADVFETPGPGQTSRVHTTGFSPSPDFIAKMEQKIAGR